MRYIEHKFFFCKRLLPNGNQEQVSLKGCRALTTRAVTWHERSRGSTGQANAVGAWLRNV